MKLFYTEIIPQKRKEIGEKMGRFCGFLRRLCLGAFVACVVAFGAGATHAACSSNQIDVNGDGSQCETTKFSVTTTSDTTSLVWIMTATGTFYADCDDGGTLSQSGTTTGSTISSNTITRTGTSETTYTCTWGSAGAHTVRFAGIATGYKTNYSASDALGALPYVGPISFYKSSGGTQTHVASVDGSLGALFPQLGTTVGQYPMFGYTFKNATALTSLPSTLFSGLAGAFRMFYHTFDSSGLTGIPSGLFGSVGSSGANSLFDGTFYGCTRLTSIPETLFNTISYAAQSMFSSTFSGCTGLTGIPAGLFNTVNGGSTNMFSNTFSYCTSLISIPETLFSHASAATYLFTGTFQGCSGLTSAGVPTGLFSNITTGANYMFNNTFRYCSGLTSVPVGLFSSITTGAYGLFEGTFYGCTGLTTIPAGLFSSITTGGDYMFSNTFQNCTNLSSIPARLFSGIYTGKSYMFYRTFYNCTKLAGYIPPDTFAGLIANNSSTASNIWNNTFTNTQLVTSCPVGTEQYITGYEGTDTSTYKKWNGKVSCGCESGYWGDGTTCTACSNSKPANSSYYGVSITSTCPWACDGGYYSANGTSCTAVSTGYYSPAGSNTQTACTNTKPANSSYSGHGGATNSCPWACDGGYYSANGTSCTAVSTGYYSPAGDNDQHGCTNMIPENSSYSGGASSNACPYACDAGYVENNGVCEACTKPEHSSYTAANSCAWACDAGYYANGNSCVACAAGTYNVTAGATSASACLACAVGEYSGAGASACTACTNGPANSVYTSNATSNACTHECATGYYASGNACVACTGAPENASYNTNTSACTWECNTKYELQDGECVSIGCNTFTVTTTSLSSGATIKFDISATGSFEVDCGDGGTLSGTGVSNGAFTRTSTSPTTYTCTYSTGGVKTIGFCGTATGYSTSTSPVVSDAVIRFNSDSNTKTKIASVGGKLGALFPTLGTGAGQQPMFYGTFKGCSNLTTISAGLFDGITGSTNSMFRETFDTTSLAEIPAGLFDGVSGGAANMFRSTFNSCPITEIPDRLFANITGAYDSEFKYSFWGCKQLKNAYIYPDTFAGLIANNSPTATDMWSEAFTGNNALMTSCPEGTTQYTTGYEDYWNSKVSCQLNNNCTGATYYDNGECIACPTGYDADLSDKKDSINQCKIACTAGTYVATAGGACVDVGAGYYAAAQTVAYGDTGTRVELVTCTGAQYRNATNECVACPTGYGANTEPGKTSDTQCQISCSAGYYLAAANDATCSPVGYGYYTTAAQLVNYGSTSTKTQCSNAEETTVTETSTSEDACVLSCAGATYFDSTNDVCTACPAGYNANTESDKMSASECQISCAGGTYVATAGGACVAVGDGYYAAGGLVTYGQTSTTRSQCPGGSLTGKQNAVSISECQNSCTGATYYDLTTGECAACPAGYVDDTTNGKDDATMCAAHCNAGTYLQKYTPVAYLQASGSQYVDTGVKHTSSSNIRGVLVVGNYGALSRSNVNFIGNQNETATDGKTGYGVGWATGFKIWVQSSKNRLTGANAPFSANTENKFTVEYTLTNNKRYLKSSKADGTQIDNTGDGYTNASHAGGLVTVHPIAIFDNGDHNTQQMFTGRIYSVKVWDDDELILDLIPVRRNSDNELGFYNVVTKEFYGNSGDGTFTTATCTGDNCDDIIECSPVGYGYYAPASNVEYDNLGTRYACPNGGTTTVNNATNIYACTDITECTGATYPNATTGACMACPTGYTDDATNGKAYVTECKISCAAGTYLATSGDTTCTAAETGYWSAAANIGYGNTNEPTACDNKPSNSAYTGAGTSASCPYACDATYYLSTNECIDAGAGYYSPAADNNRYSCTNEIPSNSSYSGSAATNSCPWTCDSGYGENNGVCELLCAGVMYLGRCHARCPVGAGELHVGQYVYPLFIDKTNVPSPVIHLRYPDNTMCYGYLEAGHTPTGQHGLHVMYNNNIYHAINPE